MYGMFERRLFATELTARFLFVRWRYVVTMICAINRTTYDRMFLD